MEVILSLGSNLDDRLDNIKKAVELISCLKDVEVVEKSPTYESEPVDVAAEDMDKPFLNSVIIISTECDLTTLLGNLQNIEVETGRPSDHGHNQPRTIDIDIICAGNIVMNEPSLTVPHPRWEQRRFVVQPLADIRPDMIIPGSSTTVHETLLSLPEAPKVIPYRGNN